MKPGNTLGGHRQLSKVAAPPPGLAVIQHQGIFFVVVRSSDTSGTECMCWQRVLGHSGGSFVACGGPVVARESYVAGGICYYTLVDQLLLGKPVVARGSIVTGGCLLLWGRSIAYC